MSFSHFFLNRITYHHVRCLLVQKELYLWRHIPNTRLIYLWSPIDVSRGFILVLARSLSIQKFILRKVCLKAVVKVALSLQRIASARQVKISNHTMIVPSKLAPVPVRWTNSCRGRKRVWGHASKSIFWRNRSTRMVFYLASSFRFFQNLKQFVSKEVLLDSICVTVFENVCFVDMHD